MWINQNIFSVCMKVWYLKIIHTCWLVIIGTIQEKGLLIVGDWLGLKLG